MSRTLQDAQAEFAAKHAELKAILGDNGKTLSAQELADFERLKPEVKKLEAEVLQAKSIDDERKESLKRDNGFSTPANRPPFNDGTPNSDSREHDAQFDLKSFGSLKHIVFEPTRQDNERLAYKFFQWFAGYCLPQDSRHKPQIAALSLKAQKWCEERGIKALAENAPDTGGVLVPPEFDTMLIRLVETYGRFRNYAKVVPMASETKTEPRRTGGVTAYWIGEGNTITASNPTYDNVQLVAEKLAALCVMSSEINEDSALSISDQLAFEIAYAFALMEDQAGFTGDGTSTYGGITGLTNKLKNLDSTIANIAGLQVATGTGYGTNYNSTVLADFNAVVGLLPQYADSPNTGWFVHKSYFHTVMQKLELAAGGVTANEVASGDRRPRPLFLGYPVNFCQVMPRVSATSQVCALFGDLTLSSLMGDRRQRTLFTDPYSLAARDQVQVRGTERVDIINHDVGNASSTAALRVPGPVVGLITASS